MDFLCIPQERSASLTRTFGFPTLDLLPPASVSFRIAPYGAQWRTPLARLAEYFPRRHRRLRLGRFSTVGCTGCRRIHETGWRLEVVWVLTYRHLDHAHGGHLHDASDHRVRVHPIQAWDESCGEQ